MGGLEPPFYRLTAERANQFAPWRHVLDFLTICFWQVSVKKNKILGYFYHYTFVSEIVGNSTIIFLYYNTKCCDKTLINMIIYAIVEAIIQSVRFYEKLTRLSFYHKP